MASITLSDATDKLQHYCDLHGLSELTLSNYSSDIRMLYREAQLEVIPLDELELTCARWLTWSKRNKSAKTVGRRKTSCVALGRGCGQTILRDYSVPTPARAFPHPLPNGEQDLRRMLDAATNHEQRALIALLGLCGLRVAEALSVTCASFDWSDKVVKIHGKGDKVRIVPLSNLAFNMLFEFVMARYFARQQQVITYADRTARHCVTKLAERAGIIRSVSSHDLRATFATAAYAQSNFDIRVVQELLGHSSIVQTQLYVGVPMEDMRAAASFMDEEDD